METMNSVRCSFILISQVVSFVFNMSALAYIFWAESQRAQFLLWHLKNAYSFNAILTLSCLDMQIARIIHSRVLGFSLTNARITADTRARLTVASFAAMLFENIPQLWLECVIAQKMGNSNNDVVVLAIILSSFDIVQSVMGLLTWTIIGSYRRESIAEEVATQYWKDTFEEPLRVSSSSGPGMGLDAILLTGRRDSYIE